MSDILKFLTFEGGNVHLNCGNAHSILRIPPRDELLHLFQDFRERQLKWALDYLLSPHKNSQLIRGLASSRTKSGTRDGAPTWQANSQRVLFKAIPEHAWNLISDISPVEGGARATKIFNATIAEQRAFFLAAMGPNLESLESILRPDFRDSIVCSWLSDAIEEHVDPSAFLQALIKRTVFERSRPLKKTNSPCSRIPELFLYWLAQHDILLSPVRFSRLRGESTGLEDYTMTPQLEQLWTLLTTAYHRKEVENFSGWMPRLKVAFEILTRVSTLRSSADLSLDMFEKLHERMDEECDRSNTDRIRTIYRAIRDSLGRRDLPTFSLVRKSRPTLENPFAWTRLSTNKHPSSTFPRHLWKKYEPRASVIEWADRFALYLTVLPVKSVGNTISTLQRFLVWLIQYEVPASRLTELTRSLINDERKFSESNCFRAYLGRSNMSPETANGNILRLANAFDMIIEKDRLEIANPVVIRFDVFKSPSSRGKTPRRPMGRDLMTLVRDLNRRNDFELSRSISSHHRDCLNQDGKYESIWFPAFAVIIDLLLWLPLRGFQARFLDSGEGDELTVRFEGGEPYTVESTAETKISDRREGVFYIFDSKDDMPMLGIYVNTNKTSIDRNSGYEIAWCSAELRESLCLMRDWQLKYNPVAIPIPCIERHEFEKTENQDVLDSLKTSFPLFRDPAAPAGWPITREKVFDYWSRLLARAEDELAAQGVNTRLTEVVMESKGPKKSPRAKRIALYDIHTLRVSGISALIEAGLPPDMVQDIAGHATVVMTMYYNKIKASRLNESMSKAMDALHVNLENIDGMSDEELERLENFLVNSRAPEDASGHSLLKQRMGHGDNAIEIHTHGICPGGECSTGGEFQNQAVGYAPVPRPMACPLCRYRLTGPMFITGLVLNANHLLFELRSKGKEIAEMNEKRQLLSDAGKPSHSISAKIEALYRETDVIAMEWAAEVQYVHIAESKLSDFLRMSQGDCEEPLPALMTGMDLPLIETKIVRRSEFALLQTLVEGAQIWPGFKPSVAINEHREFLNELLVASNLEPFLLRLRSDQRDAAATLLGRVVASLVPDDQIGELRNGGRSLEGYPAALELYEALKERALGGADFDSNFIPWTGGASILEGEDE